MIEAITEAIGTPLKASAFRRHGLTWNRTRGTIAHVVHLQRSRFTGPGVVKVTMNIGIWIEPVWKICWNKPTPKVIKEEECFPRFRIGKLVSDFSFKSADLWWKAVNTSQAQEVGQELTVLLKTKVFPFFERCWDEAAVKDLVTANPSLVSQPVDKIYLSILAHQIGEERLCAELLSNLTGKAWQELAKSVIERLHGAAQVEHT